MPRGNAESDALCFGVMGGAEHETLSLLPLDPGKSGLLDGFAQYIGSRATVCLEKKTHRSGVQMAVECDYPTAYYLSWEQLTEQHHRTCADLQEATEFGAYGVAILVVRKTTGKSVLERSAKGPGFDFWIGDEEDDELPFQGLTRLEVSGIAKLTVRFHRRGSSTIETIGTWTRGAIHGRHCGVLRWMPSGRSHCLLNERWRAPTSNWIANSAQVMASSLAATFARPSCDFHPKWPAGCLVNDGTPTSEASLRPMVRLPSTFPIPPNGNW